MILADTSVWVDHFRGTDDSLHKQLSVAHISIHPFVVAELALGSLKQRMRTIAELEMLSQVKVANLREVRSLIEAHNLHSKGIGLIDVHLIASTLLTQSTQLWTRDKRLQAVAEEIGIAASLK
jgi:predicted nucleic acid-binding protein